VGPVLNWNDAVGEFIEEAFTESQKERDGDTASLCQDYRIIKHQTFIAC
jgi:hypothetical protein